MITNLGSASYAKSIIEASMLFASCHVYATAVSVVICKVLK